ncbi:MAG: mechanosensitive ion channel [Euryarchaeota archaeon]|nr:mechanosensitive ion channel [Euryarchaeota archaeon]
MSGVPTLEVLTKGLFAAAVAVGLWGLHTLVVGVLLRTATKRRAHDIRNVLRLVFGAVGIVALLGVLTDQWVGVLLSLGVVGFAITFALQQPLLSLLGWFYIMTKRPYGVGDRVRIGETKGDVIEVDFLVTTIWEIGGELVSTNQPSGRVVTVPNSMVLDSEVTNFGGGGSEYVWNELAIQVSYETDLDVASTVMIEEADEVIGAEMVDRIADFRERLAETPVELEVTDRPTVNIVQAESWVELRLRYVVHPRRGTRVRNELYERILERFNENPTVTSFPVSRNR